MPGGRRTTRGITWTIAELTLLHDQYIRCSDVMAAVGPDGGFYAGGEPLSAPMPAVGWPGEIRRDCLVSYVYSTDGGKTWSPRVEAMGSDSIRNNRFAPGLKPSINGLPSDRPWIEIDQSTGNVYVTARGAVEDRPGVQQRWVLASHDKGKTFGLLYAIDSAEYPSKSGHGAIAASHGILAAAYFSDSVPAGAPGKRPCLIFEVSQDDGKTWERRQVQDSGSMSPSGLNIFVVADDTKPGHYSIMEPTADSLAVAVVTTEDSGKSWTAQVIAGSTPSAIISKSWVRYSPKGDLAVMWRGIFPDGSFRVWAALSKDGGRKFSTPVQVSHGSSPPPSRERGAFLFGDDLSGLAADASAVHVVWADSRAGFQGTWYGRVPI